jgi:uncharacterized protein (DUF952 family)
VSEKVSSLEKIYHICKREAWDDARKKKSYQADSLKSEGFIHCSKYGQILRVAGAFYRGQKDLVILVIEPEMLKSQMLWEPGGDKPDELFPHIHGALNIEAVSQVLDFRENPDGHFYLPPVEE